MRAVIGPDYEAIMDTMREMLPRESPVVRDATVPAYLWGDRLLPIYEPGTSLSQNEVVQPRILVNQSTEFAGRRPESLYTGQIAK